MKLWHPDLDVTVDVHKESKAQIMERSGWLRLKDATAIEIQVADESPSDTDDFVLEVRDETPNDTEEV